MNLGGSFAKEKEPLSLNTINAAGCYFKCYFKPLSKIHCKVYSFKSVQIKYIYKYMNRFIL